MAIKVTLFILFILAILIFIGLAIWRGWKAYDDDAAKWPAVVFGVLAVVMVFCTIFIPGNIHQVNSGEVAVVRKMGTITGTREAGVYWDFYMTHDYVVYDKKVQEISIETQTYSKDNQIIGVQANLQYQINSSIVDKLATEYGTIDKLESKVKSIALDNIKSVFAQNTATDVINNRALISSNISETVEGSMKQKVSIRQYSATGTYVDYNNKVYFINPNTNAIYEVLDIIKDTLADMSAEQEVYDYALTHSQERYDIIPFIDIRTIVLTNIDFTEDFEAAVAAKVAAAQEAEKAENEARKAEIEAEAARVVAEKQADAALYKAQKEAEAKLAAASADAEAQLLIASAEAKATKVKAVEVARMLGFNITETQTTDGIEYEIDFSGIQPDDARYKLMVNYLEYIQYLETWDGTLPVTLVGDGSATVLIPSTN